MFGQDIGLNGSERKQATARYGYDATVRVVCDGVTGSLKW